MTPHPHACRRWSRFSLRTLLVLLTLVCFYLGWAMNWIRQRQAFLRDARHDSLSAIADSVPWRASAFLELETPPAPLPLRILNEPGTANIFYFHAEQQQLLQTSRLFPEAKIYFYEVTNHSIHYRAAVLLYILSPFQSLPYYQDGSLYRAEILERVSHPQMSQSWLDEPVGGDAECVGGDNVTEFE